MSYKTSNVNNYPKLQLSQIGKRLDGILFGFGRGIYGSLGLGDTSNRLTPTLTAFDSWKEIKSGSFFSLAIESNGTLWAWGLNSFGQLGLGNQTNPLTQFQIGTESYWTRISAGEYRSLAIQSDGTLWAWGLNSYGQLGLSDRTNRSSPVQVGSLSNWTEVFGAPDSVTSFALQSNGTLWAWGANSYGQLGLDDRTHRSSPVQVGLLSNWSKVFNSGSFTSSTIALKSDGTLWSWGNNNAGGLGLNTAVGILSPVQVGTSVWAQISGGNNAALAIQSDGTLWAWGYNFNGALGLSDLTNRSSPTQVGTKSYWTKIETSGVHSIALQSDGTLWTWGSNQFGQLGSSNVTNRSSPVQVGIAGQINVINCGYQASFLIQTKYF